MYDTVCKLRVNIDIFFIYIFVFISYLDVYLQYLLKQNTNFSIKKCKFTAKRL